MKHEKHPLAQMLEAAGGGGVGLATLGALLGDAAVFAVNAERNIVYWSPGAEKLLGYSPQEVLGSFCLKANRCHSCMRGCGVMEHSTVHGQPLEMLHADGSSVQVRKYAQALRDAHGTFVGAIELLVPEVNDIAAASRAAADAAAQDFHGLWSQESAMLRIFDLVRQVAATDATVLLRGESGTGKELVARALHAESPRKHGPFVAVNCAALTPSLVESELFGHAKGAFTGALHDRAGLFTQADGGTLFLDEVAELSLEIQAKLLRVLQERTFVPVGGTKPHTVSVRVVGATHRSLRDEVRHGRFREDLMYRLRVVPIFLPPLRARRSDIALLFQRFLTAESERGPKTVTQVSPQALEALRQYSWPGNIRELQNVAQYAYAMSQGESITVQDLPPEIQAPNSLTTPVHNAPEPPNERQRLQTALEAHRGNVTEAAQALGMSRTTFWRRRKALGV